MVSGQENTPPGTDEPKNDPDIGLIVGVAVAAVVVVVCIAVFSLVFRRRQMKHGDASPNSNKTGTHSYLAAINCFSDSSSSDTPHPAQSSLSTPGNNLIIGQSARSSSAGNPYPDDAHTYSEPDEVLLNHDSSGPQALFKNYPGTSACKQDEYNTLSLNQPQTTRSAPVSSNIYEHVGQAWRADQHSQGPQTEAVEQRNKSGGERTTESSDEDHYNVLDTDDRRRVDQRAGSHLDVEYSHLNVHAKTDAAAPDAQARVERSKGMKAYDSITGPQAGNPQNTVHDEYNTLHFKQGSLASDYYDHTMLN
ncbi:hypothetical protein BaRGS_00036650 [Batillaria attramentaria]|uniref:Uncharacterized protein n=1 Tax=Batillaria attramentaria TaxID=370345 RepID=A0ABD0JB95_9CAEN